MVNIDISRKYSDCQVYMLGKNNILGDDVKMEQNRLKLMEYCGLSVYSENFYENSFEDGITPSQIDTLYYEIATVLKSSSSDQFPDKTKNEINSILNKLLKSLPYNKKK